jgi:large subunit ribosomal protein L21
VPEPEQLAAASEPKRLPEEASTPIQPQPALAIEPVLSADDLTALHGVGPAIAKKLNEAGVVSFKQIAAWTGADIERVEEAVLAGRFAGRIRKDNWVEQAQEFVSATT